MRARVALGPALSTWVEWWPVAVGLVLMYAPTYAMLWRDTWGADDQAHGPIVVGISLWLLGRERQRFASMERAPSWVAGSALLLVGVLAYVLGRSQGIPLFDVGSQIPVLAALVLCAYGWRGLRLAWFPIFLLLFVVPLPGVLMDWLTGPLKEYVSVLTERTLYATGYPIARDGVTLAIGPYQLLVADACSGLHSMYSLTALGLLYVYLTKPKGFWRKAILILSIWPIAFAGNLVRVIILVLVTYYFGDAAGQGFLHGFAGLLLFLIALGLLFALDSLLRLIHRAPAAHYA